MITRPCLNFTTPTWTWPPLKLEHGRVITFHCFACVNERSPNHQTILHVHVPCGAQNIQEHLPEPRHLTWWRHQMETFSALLAICAGNSPVPGDFSAQRPVTRSFNVFFDLRLNKRLSKQLKHRRRSKLFLVTQRNHITEWVREHSFQKWVSLPLPMSRLVEQLIGPHIDVNQIIIFYQHLTYFKTQRLQFTHTQAKNIPQPRPTVYKRLMLSAETMWFSTFNANGLFICLSKLSVHCLRYYGYPFLYVDDPISNILSWTCFPTVIYFGSPKRFWSHEYYRVHQAL